MTVVKEPEFVIIGWRDLRKGKSLQAFLDIELPSSMVLLDCTYHKRDDGARWVSLPARQYQKADGTTAWAQIIDFANKDAQKRFQKLAREAVDRYLSDTTDGKDATSRKRGDDARDRALAVNRAERSR
jgi:hypothetical protein